MVREWGFQCTGKTPSEERNRPRSSLNLCDLLGAEAYSTQGGITPLATRVLVPSSTPRAKGSPATEKTSAWRLKAGEHWLHALHSSLQAPSESRGQGSANLLRVLPDQQMRNACSAAAACRHLPQITGWKMILGRPGLNLIKNQRGSTRASSRPVWNSGD